MLGLIVLGNSYVNVHLKVRFMVYLYALLKFNSVHETLPKVQYKNMYNVNLRIYLFQ